MCGGCTPTTAASFLGAILINSSFIALISWGTATFWPIGFSFAVVYTVLLFVGAWQLRKREAPAIAVDVTLLLAVLGVAASGLIVAYNTVGCRPDGGVPTSSGTTTWSFDSSNVSRSVAAWAAEDMWASGSGSSATFATVNGATFFTGRENSSDIGAQLWRVAVDGTMPLDAALKNPRGLVLVRPSQRVCLVAYSQAQSDAVHCYSPDGLSFTTLAAQPAPDGPRALIVENGALWFKARAPFGVSPSAGVVYKSSADFTTAVLLSSPADGSTLPSPPPPSSPGQGPVDCDAAESARALAIAILFLASLPLLITASILWYRLSVPSMALATFVGGGALVLNIYLVADPSGNDAFDWIKWWSASFGFAWLLLFASLKLTERVDSSTLAWAVNTGSIAYFGALHTITEVPFTTSAVRWVAYNLSVVVPMFLLALVVSSRSGTSSTWLPLMLCSIGIFADTWKVTDELTQLASDPTLQMFIRFIVLGAVGVGIVLAGLAYNNNASAIADAVDAFAARACGPCRQPRAKTVDPRAPLNQPGAARADAEMAVSHRV